MNQPSLFRIHVALGLVGSVSLSALNLLLPVQAQAPSFMPADSAESLPITVNAVDLATDQSLSEPADPRVERGIICAPGQLPEDCDDRVPMLDRSQPWSAIGRILRVHETPEGTTAYQCTGTLIADNLVLTNAHCVVDPETHQPFSEDLLLFEPNLINGVLANQNDRAQIIGGVYGTDFSDKAEPPDPNDWAIVRLDRSLGSTYGVIPLQALPLEVFSNNPDALTLVGYSGDFPNPDMFANLQGGKGLTPSVAENCGVVGESEDGVLIHDCDMRGGASGGPILAWIDDQPYIPHSALSTGTARIN